MKLDLIIWKFPKKVIKLEKDSLGSPVVTYPSHRVAELLEQDNPAPIKAALQVCLHSGFGRSTPKYCSFCKSDRSWITKTEPKTQKKKSKKNQIPLKQKSTALLVLATVRETDRDRQQTTKGHRNMYTESAIVIIIIIILRFNILK